MNVLAVLLGMVIVAGVVAVGAVFVLPFVAFYSIKTRSPNDPPPRPVPPWWKRWRRKP